jgi:hypothetical protein
MASEPKFDAAYAVLSKATEGFTRVTQQTLTAAVLEDGAALAPLRMIIGFTHNELAAAIKLVDRDASGQATRSRHWSGALLPSLTQPLLAANSSLPMHVRLYFQSWMAAF